MMFARTRPRFLLLLTALLSPLALQGCDSPSGPTETPMNEVGVVVNSLERSLTIFRVDDPSVRSTVGLGPDGSPVSLAVRGEVAVVPLGAVPAAAVVDLRGARLLRTIPLPAGSGATGVAFLNDSIALVANSNLRSVSPINVRTGERGVDLTVGRFPQAIASVGDTAYVINGELGPDFQPVGPGSVSVIAGSPLHVLKTIPLSGTNPGAAAIGGGGRVYVVNSGRFGQSEGSLSVLDRGSLTELSHHTGFLSFPGSVAVDDGNHVYVGGFGIGLLVWDSQSGTFIRGANDPVTPGGVASTSGVGVDSEGRLYALEPECGASSVALRLTASYSVETEIPVGICPITIAFTRVAAPDA